MRVGTMIVAVLVTGTTMVGIGEPAGAAVVVTSVGTTVTAVVSGEAGAVVQPSCQGGSVRVGGVAALPPVACTAVTAITITADGASQVLVGEPTPAGSMPALTAMAIDAGAGDDDITGSTAADTITLGAGDDELFLPAVGGDDTVDGTPKEVDTIDVIGTAGDDDIALVSPDPEVDVATVTNGDWTATVDGNLGFIVHAGAGDDGVDASGMADDTHEGIDLWGEAGDDRIVAAPASSALHGGTGTNELVGGADEGDAFLSSSATDVFASVGDGDSIADLAGPVGRDLPGLDGVEGLAYSVAVRGNTGIRVAPVGAAGAAITVTGARTGRQVLGPAFDSIALGTHGTGQAGDHVVAEIVRLAAQAVDITGAPGTVVDIVTPPAGGPFRSIHVSGTGSQTRSRTPIADADDRFAYRVLRDLPAALPNTGQVLAGGESLRAGEITRTEVAVAATTDRGFRAVQVDGAYAEILGRTADEDGQGYWVDRLGDRLLLRKLRASFYGTPEALAQRGGTDPSFVAAVYAEVLGRTPTPTEVAYWVGVIQGGLPRGTVADRFLNTPEARVALIVDRFLAFADRAPTAAEVETWSLRLASSRTDGQIALTQALVASHAYFTRPEL